VPRISERASQNANGPIAGLFEPVAKIDTYRQAMNECDRDKLITELVVSKLPALVLFARQWGDDFAEDAVQEAIMQLMRLADPPHDPLAWLFAAVRNASNQYMRTQTRRKNREIKALAEKKPWFNRADEDNELISELQQLPIDCRTVIVAKIWGNLTFEQIAATIGSSKSSAHRKYEEGLALLRKKWDQL
jgi:RNA polymerase sigma-70 factor (ECF subfamily)